MTREILFKAKRKDNNEWVYGQIVYDKDKIPFIVEEVERENQDEVTDLYAISWYEVIPSTICEYTGLPDKNGVKIFENDICKGNDYSDENELFIIKYGKYKTKDWKNTYISNTYQFGWYAEFIKDKSQVHLVSPNGIEVIGNVFN